MSCKKMIVLLYKNCSNIGLGTCGVHWKCLVPHAVNCVRFCVCRCLWLFCLCMKYLGNCWMDLRQIHTEDVFRPSLKRVWMSRSIGTRSPGTKNALCTHNTPAVWTEWNALVADNVAQAVVFNGVWDVRELGRFAVRSPQARRMTLSCFQRLKWKPDIP